MNEILTKVVHILRQSRPGSTSEMSKVCGSFVSNWFRTADCIGSHLHPALLHVEPNVPVTVNRHIIEVMLR